jgi:four helix bundle protein
MDEKIKIKSFRDLMVWQKAAELAVKIYSLTNSFPQSEIYGLVSQIRRSTISVSSNIAEGFKRSSRKEKANFYTIALGSLSELEGQLEISKRLGYLKLSDYNELILNISEINKMLSKLTKSAENKL